MGFYIATQALLREEVSYIQTVVVVIINST